MSFTVQRYHGATTKPNQFITHKAINFLNNNNISAVKLHYS